MDSKKIIVGIVISVPLLTFVHYSVGANALGLDQQNIYYFYSSAAQAIATFIAFIIAGYALVYQAMDNLENKDETLEDIHHAIKKNHYYNIKILSIITGLAIISSLMVVWFNRFDFPLFKMILMSFADIMILITIFGAIWLVITIIDPDKIKKTAKKLYEEEFEPTDIKKGYKSTQVAEKSKITDTKEESELHEDSINEYKFLKNFRDLEREISNLLERSDIPFKSRYKFPSFREMIKALRNNGMISNEIYDRLVKISNYRNFVAHGEPQKVDEGMIEEIEDLKHLIKSINRFNRKI